MATLTYFNLFAALENLSEVWTLIVLGKILETRSKPQPKEI
jgi:hypothetical protein